jgi:hypothetical protein
MDYQNIIQSIKPDLTLYSVLITLAIVAFAFGRFFWKYEKQLGEENIERIKDLINGYRVKYIDPIISKQLHDATDTGYIGAINSLIEDIHPKTYALTGSERKLLNDIELKEIIKIPELEGRLEKEKRDRNFYIPVDQFLSSESGEKLFDSLDHAYEQRIKLTAYYDHSCKYSAKCSYSFFILAILLFVGILQLIGQWPTLVINFWAFFSVQAFLSGLYYFIRIEFYRRKLMHTWKELQLYGKI